VSASWKACFHSTQTDYPPTWTHFAPLRPASCETFLGCLGSLWGLGQNCYLYQQCQRFPQVAERIEIVNWKRWLGPKRNSTESSNPLPDLRNKICMASSTETVPLASLSFIRNSTTLNKRRGSYPVWKSWSTLLSLIFREVTVYRIYHFYSADT
jgi:hypothetical protein